MKRFGYGFEFGLTIFHASTSTGQEVTWDPSNMEAHVTLSGDNLTASTDQYDFYANIRGTVSHNTGKRALKFTLTYPTEDFNWEAVVGLCNSTEDPSAGNNPNINANTWTVTPDGTCSNDSTPGSLSGVAIVSGHAAFVAVDFDAGKIWFGDEGGFSGDPEAGTGAALTFTPGTALYPFASMFSNDAPNLVSVVLDPTYSSGSFAAWDGSEPVEETVTWDANNQTPGGYVLSNNDLTAETLGNGAAIATTVAMESGKYMFRAVVTNMTEALDYQEACLALAPPDCDPADILFTNGYLYTNDGNFSQAGFAPSATGLPTFGIGEGACILYDQTTGKGWCGNDSMMDGDPEAGTGETFALAPGTVLTPCIYCYSNDGVTPVGMTLDPSAASGTFLALDGTVADASTTWDAASKGAHVALSNGDLTFSTEWFDDYEGVRSTTSHSTGKRCFRVSVDVLYPDTEAVQIGVAMPGWTEPGNAFSFGLLADGYGQSYALDTVPANDYTADLGLTFGTGDHVRCFIDFDAGKAWFGNESTVSGDPEAGTGAAITFPPNTELHIAASVFYAEAGNPLTCTLDPTYSSGTFAAWDS